MSYTDRTEQHQKFYDLALTIIATYSREYLKKGDEYSLEFNDFGIAHVVSRLISETEEIQSFDEEQMKVILMNIFFRLTEFPEPIPVFAAQLTFDEPLISHIVKVVHQSVFWKAGGRIDPMHF
jgi:hypothetical protein